MAAEPVSAPTTAIEAGTSCTAPVPTAAAMKAYVDPTTGQLAASPTGAQDAEPPMTPSNHAPEAALVEHPVPGGGMTIELDDRFFSFSTATKVTDGKLSICHTPLPASK